jgi:hypothetical protein
MPRPPTDDPDRTRLTTFLFRTRTLAETGALDLRLYTSPHRLRMTGTVNTARNNFHGCTLHAARLSSYCTSQHPCTVLTAAHHIHTRPPDIRARLAYQRPLVNTYRTSDLRRQRARQGDHRHDHRRALAITQSGAGVDLPGARYTMTGSDDDAPAARGPPLGGRARRSEARESSRTWRPADFPAPSSFTCCTVRCHEDVPRHIYRLFQALEIQYRRVLTRGPLGRELVKAEDLAIDDAKEASWMAVYEHERDLLEDTVYSRLVSLWSEFSDAYAVFNQHGPDQLLCDQQVWEALLTTFPLKHKRMQTVLLAREIGRLMAWDGDSKNAVNTHFGKVGDIRRDFEYMDTLTIDNVFRSVILATLKSSTNRALRTTRSLTTWTTTRTSLLRTSKPSVLANLGVPRIDTRFHLTAPTPRALRRAPRRSTPRSTTSTSIKEVTNSPPSFATPLKNMVNNLGRFSAEPASLTPSGTSPLQSPTSSWPPRNTSPARSPVTLTMPMTPTMTLPPPMNRMIDPEIFLSLWEAYRVSFFFSLYVSSGFIRGGHVTHNLSSLLGAHVLKSASLR